MRPTAAQSIAKREAILTTAQSLFFEYGYGAVSIDAIVKQVGGSKTNIYTYFGGKDGLFKAVVERVCDELLHPLRTLETHGLTPQEVLTRFGQRYLELVLKPQATALYRLVVAESHRFPELGQIFFEAGPDVGYGKLTCWIEAQQQAGHFVGHNPRLLAVQFLDMVRGEMQLKLLLGIPQNISKPEIQQRVSSVVDVFLHGVQTSNSAVDSLLKT